MVCPEFLSSVEGRVGLDFFSAAECSVCNVLPDIYIDTLPVILAFYKTVGVSGSLVTEFGHDLQPRWYISMP